MINVPSDIPPESVEKMPFSTTVQYVYGHQDDLGRPLTVLESLNVDMDAMAKFIANNHRTYRTSTSEGNIEGYGIMSIDEMLTTSHMQKHYTTMYYTSAC